MRGRARREGQLEVGSEEAEVVASEAGQAVISLVMNAAAEMIAVVVGGDA